MNRADSVGVMVIRELIREYQMKFDPSVSNLKSFSFGGGDLMASITSAASSWLKATLLAAGGVFIYKNRDALEGLGKVVADKVVTTATNIAATAVTPTVATTAVKETRHLREVTYNTRFGHDIMSDDLASVAKRLVGLIGANVIPLTKVMDVSSKDNLESSLNTFNADVIRQAKLIVALCTSSSRSYPRSLTTDFSVDAPPLPEDAKDEGEAEIAGQLLLDVASIQLYNMLILNVAPFYGEVKAAIDEQYDTDEEQQSNKVLSDLVASKLRELSGNLARAIEPAKQILVKS